MILIMKGSKKNSAQNNAMDTLERERIIKIMATPVNPRSTELYWMAEGRFKRV